MYDNICTLPLPYDVFAQAIHPVEPILSVALSSGHIKTFRLPPIATTALSGSQSNGDGGASFIGSRGRRLSENGFDTIDTIWQTRRHKGSCRALAFSSDGSVLFSAGTDGIVKAAASDSGTVISKVAIPLDSTKLAVDAPSVLQTLSPQNLLLGTDSGRLHVYDLRASRSFLPYGSRPDRTISPHSIPAEAKVAEPLTSITALPPTVASTSGTSRAWITTSGSTLALSDLRKGVVTVSEDQGDILLSAACVSGLGLSRKWQKPYDGAALETGEKILVGGAQGVLSLWDRGHWQDRSGKVAIHRGSTRDDDDTIDSLAVLPEELETRPSNMNTRTIIAGLGTGEIKFVRLRGGIGEVHDSVKHDEAGVDAVVTLGFDVAGRLISGGGQVIKVWHQSTMDEDRIRHFDEDRSYIADERQEIQVPADAQEGGSENSDKDDVDDHTTKRKKRKKGRTKAQAQNRSTAAFVGID